jgi:hypothetical protein
VVKRVEVFEVVEVVKAYKVVKAVKPVQVVKAVKPVQVVKAATTEPGPIHGAISAGLRRNVCACCSTGKPQLQ